MADEAKIAAAVEAAEAPEKSARETIEDGLESTEEVTVAPEATEEVSTEAEEAAKAITPGEEEAPADDLSDIDRIIKESEGEEKPEVTPNVQKRFDKLTAEKKALEERLQKLESQQAPKEGTKYTDAQLKGALKKAMEDGDSDLTWQIMDEMRKNTKAEIVEMYENEKKSYVDRESKINSEWKETVDAYSKYADTKVPEIWPNSHKDLDLKNGVGMLYQIAMRLYNNPDPEKAAYYKNQPGGQKLAVADALTYLMRTKAGKKTDTKVKKLEKQLTKERMKKSPVSGGPSGAEKSSKTPLTDSDVLADYIGERKTYQEEREH
jgi:hypothetical protein